MAGILKVDQIQNTAGVNIMDLQNDEIRVWNGSGYSSMATPGALISINTFTSQNGTWNSKSTSGGSGTWTKPNGCGHVLVYVTGGGGGARVNDNSYRGAGGGGGATAIKYIDVSSVNSVNYTYGGGGGYARNGGRGGTGGTSSFGNYVSSGGGQGANRRQQHEGATGGNPNQGSVRIYGGSGQGHRNPPGLGHGGTSFWGGSAPTAHRQQQWAQRHRAHAAYGAGGSSGRNSERGGDGRQGIVVVYEFD